MLCLINYRISKLCWGLDLRVVDPVEVTKRVVNGVFNGVTTVELDNLAAEVCQYTSCTAIEYLAYASSRVPIHLDRCIHDYPASRLCSSCSSYCHLELAQGDKEDLLTCHQGSLYLWCVDDHPTASTLLLPEAVRVFDAKLLLFPLGASHCTSYILRDFRPQSTQRMARSLL